MSGTSIEDIQEALRREKDGKAARRLMMCASRKRGRAYEEISAEMGIPVSTISDTLRRMHQHGLDARNDRPRSGRPPIIWRAMFPCIFWAMNLGPEAFVMSSVWNVRTISMMLENGFNIVGISRTTIYRTMRLINKSWRLPGRPTHHKSPPGAIKKVFRDGLRDIVKVATMQGYVCMFMDEAHASTKTALGKTLLTKGARQAIKIIMSGKKITCFGAVGLGIRDVACYDRGNTANMILYVNRLAEKYGKIMPIMDNASYHKSIAFREVISN